MLLTTGQVLNDRYRIVRLLGQNVYGAIYRAWDINLSGPCVLREYSDAAQQAAQRFARDASRLANLRHPSLAKVIDYFALPGQGEFLVMDFIEGQDLQEKLDQAGGPLVEMQAALWILQICDVLVYLHDLPQPIFHRHLSPTNIRITPDERAVLVDFGVDPLYDALHSAPATDLLTPGYAPVECYGQQPLDGRTAVYSLGAILYHLLSGQIPPESIQRTAQDALAPLRGLNPDISGQLEAVVMKALALNPDERWQSVAEFKNVLAAALKTVSLSGVPGMAKPVQPTVNVKTPTGQPPVEKPPVEKPQPTLKVEPPAGQPQPTVHVETPVAPPPVAEVVSAALPEPRKPRAKTAWYWLAGGVGLILALVCLAVGAATYLRGGFGGKQATDTPPAATLVASDTPARTKRRPTSTATSAPEATDTAASATLTAMLPPTETPAPVPPSPTSTLAPQIIKDALGVEMAVVPAGEFVMGSNDGGDRAAHKVYLDEYSIDVYEVTNARYAECVNAGKCLFKPHCSVYSNAAYADYSVVCVNWSQAQDYCAWRGGSLPTEAQWEKAARGGLEGKTYPWGNKAPTCDKGALNGAQYLACTPHSSAPVGSFGANGYGLYDMAGNVWEWVWDWYQAAYYASSPAKNPSGPDSGQYRGSRGGSWFLDETSMQNAFRGYSDPGSWGVYVGFRCASGH